MLFFKFKIAWNLCALCKFPRIAFLLYFFGAADDLWLGIFYYSRCFNDTIFNYNFRIQEFFRIYFYYHLYDWEIIIQFCENFIWLILDLFTINIIHKVFVKFWFSWFNYIEFQFYTKSGLSMRPAQSRLCTHAGKSICQHGWSCRQHNKFYWKSCRQKCLFFVKTQKRLVLKFLSVISKVKSWIEQNILLLLNICKIYVILYCKVLKVLNFKLFASF